MKSDVYMQIVALKGLTIYHYKVLFLLLGVNKCTQTDIAVKLETTKQNINKVCKELYSMNVIIKNTLLEGIFICNKSKAEYRNKGSNVLMQYD